MSPAQPVDHRRRRLPADHAVVRRGHAGEPDPGRAQAYAAFIKYAAKPGRSAGTRPGQLPPGYVPLPGALVAQDTAAEQSILNPPVAPAAAATPAPTAVTTPASALPDISDPGSTMIASAAPTPTASTPAGKQKIRYVKPVALSLVRTEGVPIGLVRWVLPLALLFGLIAALAAAVLSWLGRTRKPKAATSHPKGGPMIRPRRNPGQRGEAPTAIDLPESVSSTKEQESVMRHRHSVRSPRTHTLRASRGLAATAVVLMGIGSVCLLTATSASASVVSTGLGGVATISSPDGTTVLTSGGSTDEFTVGLPPSPNCPGTPPTTDTTSTAIWCRRGLMSPPSPYRRLSPAQSFGFVNNAGVYYGPVNTPLPTIPASSSASPTTSSGHRS